MVDIARRRTTCSQAGLTYCALAVSVPTQRVPGRAGQAGPHHRAEHGVRLFLTSVVPSRTRSNSESLMGYVRYCAHGSLFHDLPRGTTAAVAVARVTRSMHGGDVMDSSQDGQAVAMLPWAVGLDLGLPQLPRVLYSHWPVDVFASASSPTAGQYVSMAFDPCTDGHDAFAQPD
jgi:hypothetical protein